MSNHDDEFSTRIKNGARAMAAATMMRDGVSDSNLSEEYLLEEAVLCVVVTNAVEVQDRVGLSVGIAVYDISFSWINHSCSPNACYLFLPPESHGSGQRFLITPASSNGRQPIELSPNSQFLTGNSLNPQIHTFPIHKQEIELLICNRIDGDPWWSKSGY